MSLLVRDYRIMLFPLLLPLPSRWVNQEPLTACRYKNHRIDGKVTAVWAGSAISYYEMIERIRPEDFEIVYRSKNRFRFLGNGKTKREYMPGADLAFYVYK